MAISVPTANTKSLESRVTQLEKALQFSGQSLVLQVGNSKIEITPTGINLSTSGDINIRPSGQFNVNAGTNVMVKSGTSANYEAGGQMTVKAFSKLTIRGSTVDIN